MSREAERQQAQMARLHDSGDDRVVRGARRGARHTRTLRHTRSPPPWCSRAAAAPPLARPQVVNTNAGKDISDVVARYNAREDKAAADKAET